MSAKYPAATACFPHPAKDPELLQYAHMRMRDLGITRDTFLDISPRICWICEHGFVSNGQVNCKWGCDAHTQDTLIWYRPLPDDVITSKGGDAADFTTDPTLYQYEFTDPVRRVSAPQPVPRGAASSSSADGDPLCGVQPAAGATVVHDEREHEPAKKYEGIPGPSAP